MKLSGYSVASHLAYTNVKNIVRVMSGGSADYSRGSREGDSISFQMAQRDRNNHGIQPRRGGIV